MPVILPDRLSAHLGAPQGIFTMEPVRASRQDIRPLKLALVNLMPDKETTERQLFRVLSNTPLQVEVELIYLSSHKSKNTSQRYLNQYYLPFSKIREKKYDGMIITGAPVETLAFEEVDYWKELTDLFDYAKENVYATLFLCWAAQGAMYHYYGVPKYVTTKKLLGVYENRIIADHALVRGMDPVFSMPQSRFAFQKQEDLEAVSDLVVLTASAKAGAAVVASRDGRFTFISGHPEYERNTLDQEYRRDLLKGRHPDVPEHYYREDDPAKTAEITWGTSSSLLFANWLNFCIYQQTPYHRHQIQKKVVSKFGGSSLADAEQFQKVKEIIGEQKERCHIVVSAPGKRNQRDSKVTDQLLYCAKLQSERTALRKELLNVLQQVEERFLELSDSLELPAEVEGEIRKVCRKIAGSQEEDYILSRGEYLNALIMSAYLQYQFVDAADLIFFQEDGSLNQEKTFQAVRMLSKKYEKMVVPGFYGTDSQGKIRTFERGGSDITGSILARAMGADLYENWTDVNGVMTEDPKVSKNAKTIETLSYQELYEMGKQGASVYHPAAVKYVEDGHIPLQIRNTNEPAQKGTVVRDGGENA